MAEFITNKETTLFLARVEDLAEQCRSRGKPVYMGFLDCAQQTLAENKLKYSGLNFFFWGGYEGAERVFLGMTLEPETDRSMVPLRCLEFSWRPEESLSHRDFLGSFMALQLKREVIGDICVEAGRCIAFCTRSAADLILSEIGKIGRVGVTVTEASDGSAAPEKSFLPVCGTVSSLRLDCVVALLGKLSRSSATKLISSGLVALNGITAGSCDKTINQGDRISIRGTGKFVFDGQDGISRKDKLRLNFRKYQ